MTILTKVTPAADEFIGEARVHHLINGLTLANRLGLKEGIPINSLVPWLCFRIDGKILYVAKRPYRHSISWEAIAAVNAVFGDRILVISGNKYRVRLLSGATIDPYLEEHPDRGGFGFDVPGSVGSEWNRTLYRVSGRPFADPSNSLYSENLKEGDWTQYTEEELGIGNTAQWGGSSWCQETCRLNNRTMKFKITRGGPGVSFLYPRPSGLSLCDVNWRPVLELL